MLTGRTQLTGANIIGAKKLRSDQLAQANYKCVIVNRETDGNHKNARKAARGAEIRKQDENNVLKNKKREKFNIAKLKQMQSESSERNIFF